MPNSSIHSPFAAGIATAAASSSVLPLSNTASAAAALRDDAALQQAELALAAQEAAQEAALEAAQEAARYALLRRLSPALRHHLVGEFQPIGMIAAMMDRRLQAEQPDMAALRENSAALGKLSRTAASNCVNIISWFAPKAGGEDEVSLHEGVQACLSLLGAELRFKGIVIVNEVAALDGAAAALSVPRQALRCVLPAALLALSDECAGAADLHVSAQRLADGGVQLSLSRRSADRPADNASLADYRSIRWRDVEALAGAESVGFARIPDGVRLSLQATQLPM